MESQLVLSENNEYTPRQLSTLLKRNLKGLSLLEGIKCYYRPYICPFHQIFKYIPVGSNLFDVGFGSGLFLYLSSELLKLEKVGGIEINEHMTKKAKGLFVKSTTKSTDLMSFNGIDLPDIVGSYNYISMIDVYHHIPPQSQLDFMKRLYMKMKPGAKLIFKDIDAADLLFLPFNKFHDLVLTGEIGHEVSAKVARSEFEEIGFKTIESFKVKNIFYSHYFYLFEK